MDNTKEMSKIAFNQQALTYDKDIKGQHARTLYPYILNMLKGRHFSSILDLGCGTGELLYQIQQIYHSKDLTGIDISDKMIDMANKKKINNAHFVIGDIEDLPFKNNTFDIAICNDSFHHYPAPEKVLDEAYRVLKDSGIIIIGDCWQPLFARQLMNMYMKHSKEGDVKIYSKKEMIHLLLRKFHNVNWERIGITSCISFATK